MISEENAVTHKHRLVGDKDRSKPRTEFDIGGLRVRWCYRDEPRPMEDIGKR